MTHAPAIRIAATLALSLASLSALAQQPPDITFVGTSSDNLHVEGRISANTVQQADLQETLADGTLHNHFLLAPNGQFGIIGSWHVQVGTRSIGSYDEGYEHAGDIRVGPDVDAYLGSDGHSRLTLAWDLYPLCHGGCSAHDTIRLDLQSTDASLFASSIDASTFQRYTSGSGFVSSWSQYGGGPDEPVTYYDEARFTLTAVPEPQSWTLALMGLAGIASVKARRQAAKRRGEA
jgi:hypothetical protein